MIEYCGINKDDYFILILVWGIVGIFFFFFFIFGLFIRVIGILNLVEEDMFSYSYQNGID